MGHRGAVARAGSSPVRAGRSVRCRFFESAASPRSRSRYSTRQRLPLPLRSSVNQFRQLMLVVFASGAMAGLILFAVQHFTIIPLIESAETYETAARQSHPGLTHDEEGWQPADGWQRTSFTALTTMLSGISFAAILFGFLALSGNRVNARIGALWSLAAFACFSLAPALGLPQQPPGVAIAALYERQLWWFGTAVATAMGLWLILGRGRTWPLRIAGVAC